jgi:cytochrome P450
MVPGGTPSRSDIRRRPNRHIAFGSGAHYCVGHTVARQSLRIFFDELLAGFESVDLVGEPAHLRSNFVSGIKHMNVVARPKNAALAQYAQAMKAR